MAKSVKLADIAAILNVSTVTVSKALAGQKGVSEEMREKIKKLAEELGLQCRKQGGARQVRRLVQEQVEGPLAVHLLKCTKKPGKIKAKLENGIVAFQ